MTSIRPTQAAPAPERVAVGVWSIPVPLSASPLGSVNLYAVEHDEGLVLVDAGYDDDTCWVALEAGLTLAGHVAEDVTGVFLTHNHPDHVGLADRIRGRSGAWVAINRLDALSDGSALGDVHRAARCGASARRCPRRDRRRVRRGLTPPRQAQPGASRRPLFAPDEVISEPRLDLRVVATPGHTRGHVCLLDERSGRLFGGDLLLAQGEVQLGLVVEPDDNPAGDLIASLERVASLPVSLVLPGHGDSFGDLGARSEAAIAALKGRLDVVEAHVRDHPGLTAWERCERFDWGRGWSRCATSRRFAVMQMMAWLRCLAASGSVSLDPGPPERTGAR